VRLVRYGLIGVVAAIALLAVAPGQADPGRDEQKLPWDEAAVAKGGRTVRIAYAGGTSLRALRAEVRDTPRSVRVLLIASDGPHTRDLRGRCVTIRLRDRAGSRRLVDAADGRVRPRAPSVRGVRCPRVPVRFSGTAVGRPRVLARRPVRLTVRRGTRDPRRLCLRLSRPFDRPGEPSAPAHNACFGLPLRRPFSVRFSCTFRAAGVDYLFGLAARAVRRVAYEGEAIRGRRLRLRARRLGLPAGFGRGESVFLVRSRRLQDANGRLVGVDGSGHRIRSSPFQLPGCGVAQRQGGAGG